MVQGSESLKEIDLLLWIVQSKIILEFDAWLSSPRC